MIQLGRCFSSFDQGDTPYEQAAKFGYSYLEIPLCTLQNMDVEAIDRIRQAANQHQLDIECSNMFFPGTVSLLDGKQPPESIYEYARQALAKAQRLGVKIAVLGSGKSRHRPDEMTQQRAGDLLAEIFRNLAGIAADYHITIALEPLNRNETNMIHSVEEGFAWVSRVNHPSFRLLADYYHMAEENEDLNILKTVAPVLVHTHFATPHDRQFPSKDRTGEYMPFIEALQKAGYHGGLSVECGFEGEAPSNGIHHIRERL